MKVKEFDLAPVDTCRALSPEADRHSLAGKMLMQATQVFDKGIENYPRHVSGSEEVPLKKATAKKTNEESASQWEMFRKATQELSGTVPGTRRIKNLNTKSTFESDP